MNAEEHILLHVASEETSMNALNWADIYNQAVIRCGPLNLDLWREKVLAVKGPTVARLGGNVRQQFRLTEDEMLRLVGNEGIGVFSLDVAYLMLTGGYSNSILARELQIDQFPAPLKTNRIGRSSMSKSLRTALAKNKNLHPEYRKHLDKRITKAAEEAAKRLKLAQSASDDTLVVTVSCHPLDICMLGHTNVDPNACFGQGGQGSNFSPSLCQTDGGVYIEVRRTQQPWEVYARAWGVLRDDYFMMSNWYPNTSGPVLDSVKAMSAIIASRFGFNYIQPPRPLINAIRNTEVSYGTDYRDDRPSVYSNGDQVLYRRTKEGRNVDAVNIDTDGLPYRAYSGSFTSAVTGQVFKSTGLVFPCAYGGFVGNTKRDVAIRSARFEAANSIDALPEHHRKYAALVNGRTDNVIRTFPRIFAEYLGYAKPTDSDVYVHKTKVTFDTTTGKVVLK